MKSFDEFVKTIDPVKLSNIAADAAAHQENAFAGSAQAVTLELLRLYHEWLSQQLS